MSHVKHVNESCLSSMNISMRVMNESCHDFIDSCL